MKDFSKTAHLLNDYLQKKMELGWSDPKSQAPYCLSTLKCKLLELPALALPQLLTPSLIDVDASAYAFGAALIHH